MTVTVTTHDGEPHHHPEATSAERQPSGALTLLASADTAKVVAEYHPVAWQRYEVGDPVRLSDGYLDDAEQYEPDGKVPPEVLALMRLDRVLGNEQALSAVGTGRVRGLVLGALREWHGRQPAQATTGQTGEPLVLGEAGGSEPLDAQVARLAGFIVEAIPGEPSRSEGAIDTALRLLRRAYAQHPTLAELGDSLVTVGHELTGMRQHAADLDAARTEAQRRADELHARAVTAEDEVRDLREQRDRLTDEVHLTQGRAERAGQYRAERDDARRQLVEAQRTLVELRPAATDLGEARIEVHNHAGYHPRRELHVSGAGLVVCEGAVLRIAYDGSPEGEGIVGSEVYDDGKGRPLTAADRLAQRPALVDDPRRPRLDSWPDDAVTLRYTELRQLVALHLDACPDCAGHARAMRDGETPLRVSEVLDR